MIRIAFAALAGLMLASPASAQSYPAVCTAQYGYSAKCCAESYGRTPAGAMNNSLRHAEIAECTAREKAKKKKK